VNCLLDVNVLLARGWRTHNAHRTVTRWLAGQRRFVTCPIAQLGFLRVSMSPAFGASFQDAQLVLREILGNRHAVFLADDAPAQECIPVTGFADVTDAYLVGLARKHDLKLATLDESLCRKSWASATAINPIR
jgi:predicted nucleic acid-binding protein